MVHAERVVLVALAAALVAVVMWQPTLPHEKETQYHRLGLLHREIEVLQKQPATRCPGDYGGLATEKDLRIAMFYGYANFDAVVLDSGFAVAMATALQMPCRGTMAACGFTLADQGTNFIGLKKTTEDRTATIDLYWTSVSSDGDFNRDEGARKQAEESRATKERFYKALRDSDVVLYTGHSRAGGGLGFDPSSKTDIAIDMIFRSPAKAIAKAMAARPSRLKLLSALACDSDKYYRREFHAANPAASLLLVDGNISSNQTDQINLGILNAILGERCPQEFQRSLESVDEPGANVDYVKSGG
jgi:hypothetical protein